MGKHGNDNPDKVPNPDYEPKHDGGRDAYEWAKIIQDQNKKEKGNG